MKSGLNIDTSTDVVPIINVSLVVVLTLMIISPFLDHSEHPVNLPQARAAEVDDTENVEITYTLDDQIWVGDQQLLLSEVQPVLTSYFESNPEATAVIKADKALRYGKVEQLIASVEAAKAPKIALATKADDDKEGSKE